MRDNAGSRKSRPFTFTKTNTTGPRATSATPAKSPLPRGSRYVQCPVCGKSFAIYFIEEHVESHFGEETQPKCAKPVENRKPKELQATNVDPVASGAAAQEGELPRLPSTAEACETKAVRPLSEVLKGDRTSVVSVRVPKRKREGTHQTQKAINVPLPGTRNISATDLQSQTPSELIHIALPDEMATSVLSLLMSESSFWKQSEWTVHGKVGTTNRICAVYNLVSHEQPVRT